MSKVTLIERDLDQPKEKDPTQKAYRYKWEVLVPATVFGKRIRKFFNTKGEAKAEKLTLETQLQNQKLTPLVEDVHLCAARYQKRLTPDQIEAALAGAIEYYEQSNKPFKEYADAYVAEMSKNVKRGHVGETHAHRTKGAVNKLVKWIGNPKIRDITKEAVEAFIDDRLDAGAKPGTVRSYCSLLSAILHRAVDDGVLNRHPMKQIRLPKSDTEVGILTPDELQKLLSKATSFLEERRHWHTITDEQLQALVWSKPMIDISKEMGVSDVAIGKRCRKAGIETPVKGFWNKVQSGKMPHPNGQCETNGHSPNGEVQGFRVNDPAIIPAIIIPRLMFGCFAGLRSSEIQRLTWEDVRLDLGQLYVVKGKNKNSERWVTLTPPLLDWCKKMLDDGATGPVLLGCAREHITSLQKRLAKAAGITIPHNALRHSYGSHHLVHHASDGNTAAEMGHHSAQMTFKAYRRAVTKVQAAAYWDIRV